MQTGEVLDNKYEIVSRLGAGGMGEVYKAVHTYLGSTRVIKVVHPQIAGSSDAQDRFLREARVATKVHHPNVATLHDFSSLPDGSHYMVWEYIDGENLAQRIRRDGTLPPKEALRIALQALHGLEAIHKAGIVHRDISPENLMISNEDGAVKIIDLGVAKVDDPEAVSTTRTGIFIGKLRYAAPEQLGFIPEGEKIDARTDVYAMGMVLYEMLTGRPPYEAKTPHEYFVLHATHPTAKSVELPATMPAASALTTALDRALARNRNERFASAREFAAALEEIDRTLPDTQNMPTVAVPYAGDATMRAVTEADALHRDTIRTASPTIQTPRAQMMPAAETVRTPFPAAAPAAQPMAPAPRSGSGAIWIVAAAVILVSLAGIAAVMFWPRHTSESASTTTIAHAMVTATAPAQAAQSQVNVVTTTTPATTTDTATTTATTSSAPAAAPSPQRAVAQTATPASEPPRAAQTTESESSPEPAAEDDAAANSAAGGAYVDGGDSDVNDHAMERLREAMHGVTRVRVSGGSMTDDLIAALRDEVPSLTIADAADVSIRFDGTLQHLGRGRKVRGARAMVMRHGRVVFRYVLPTETYRVGSTPAEAFAKVLSDAIE